MLGTDGPLEHSRAVDAVLERYDDAGAHERTHLRRRRVDVPQLHAEHRDVDGLERCGIVGHADLRQHDVAGRRLDAQTAGTQRVEVRAACDERHVVTALRELRAEIAADAARADHRDPHRDSVICKTLVVTLLFSTRRRRAVPSRRR
jgi:hypothetical protein